MNLADLSVDELREASNELENRIRDLRAKRLEIAQEIEARYPEPEPQDRAAAQIVVPGFVESESGAFTPGDPEHVPEQLPRRRWWQP